MSNYIITAKFYSTGPKLVQGKFALGIKDSRMADVFEAVSDFEDGEYISEDERVINGYACSNLESLISTNPECFTVEWLDGDADKLALKNIHTILFIS